MEHKLAKDIRLCQGVEQFDLGGLTEDKVNQLMKDCFSEPLDNSGCCVSFLIGGGKGTRSKYDPKMQKFVTSALVAVGYEEDRGASKETPGKFKYQHDTGKNLLFMHVYPHGKEGESQGSGNLDTSDEEDQPSGYSNDPSILILQLNSGEFQRFAVKKAKSYTAKCRVLDGLKEAISTIEDVDRKLMERRPIGKEEQKMYDCCQELAEKSKWLQGQLQRHLTGDFDLDNGVAPLTSVEKKMAMEKIEAKIAKLKQQIQKVVKEGDTKKQAKMLNVLNNTDDLLAEVKSLTPSTGLDLSHKARLLPLYKTLLSLEAIEEKASQSIQEMRRLTNELPALQEEIGALEDLSAEVFETDEELQIRTNAYKKFIASTMRSNTKKNIVKSGSSNPRPWGNATSVSSGRSSGVRVGVGASRSSASPWGASSSSSSSKSRTSSGTTKKKPVNFSALGDGPSKSEPVFVESTRKHIKPKVMTYETNNDDDWTSVNKSAKPKFETEVAVSALPPPPKPKTKYKKKKSNKSSSNHSGVISSLDYLEDDFYTKSTDDDDDDGTVSDASISSVTSNTRSTVETVGKKEQGDEAGKKKKKRNRKKGGNSNNNNNTNNNNNNNNNNNKEVFSFKDRKNQKKVPVKKNSNKNDDGEEGEDDEDEDLELNVGNYLTTKTVVVASAVSAFFFFLYLY